MESRGLKKPARHWLLAMLWMVLALVPAGWARAQATFSKSSTTYTIKYSTPIAISTLGQAITNNVPTVTGGTPTGYAISQALPAGLSFSKATGVISGTPSALSGPKSYSSTAELFVTAAPLIQAQTSSQTVTAPAAATGSMATARDQHQAILLPATAQVPNGVLIAGGESLATNGTIAAAEVYNPATGGFNPAGTMATARRSFAMALANDAQHVLVAGGSTDAGEFSTDLVQTSKAELFDFTTTAWSPVLGGMYLKRYDFTATTLSASGGGPVLLTGGEAAPNESPDAETYP